MKSKLQGENEKLNDYRTSRLIQKYNITQSKCWHKIYRQAKQEKDTVGLQISVNNLFCMEITEMKNKIRMKETIAFSSISNILAADSNYTEINILRQPEHSSMSQRIETFIQANCEYMHHR